MLKINPVRWRSPQPNVIPRSTEFGRTFRRLIKFGRIRLRATEFGQVARIRPAFGRTERTAAERDNEGRRGRTRS